MSVRRVVISGSDLAEIDPSNPRDRIAFVPLSEIRRVAVTHGQLAPRPMVQLAIGMAMIAGSFTLVGWLVGLRVIEIRFVFLAGMLIVLGALVIRSALRRGYYLRVETDRDTHKLTLGPELAAEDVKELLAAACSPSVTVRWEVSEDPRVLRSRA